MLRQLTQRLSHSMQSWMGQRFTEANMKGILRDVRKALLEADVAYSVIKDLLNNVQKKAAGQLIHKQASPQQALLQILYEELMRVLGQEAVPLSFNTQPPVVMMMVGLQGTGKTTSTAKLAAHLLKTRKHVMVVSTDVYRPAAIEQLKVQASSVGATPLSWDDTNDPQTIAERALAEAKKKHADVLLVDTAGRLHVDAAMMDEISMLVKVLAPHEILLVVDGMQGQDAVHSAKAFQEAIAPTGVLVSKLDGDARGGALLSVASCTGLPVKLLGVGEKLDALEAFDPKRMASRIVGMGDLQSLMDTLEQKVSQADAQKMMDQIQSKQSVDLEIIRQQLLNMQEVGLGNIMDKLPGMGAMPQMDQMQAMADGRMKGTLAVLNAMTRKERKYAQILNPSRKQRIARGSGKTVQEVNQILRQIEKMQKMMHKFSSKKGMGRLMQGLKNMPGMGSSFPGGGH